jgi:hypothetical protein
MQALYSSKVKSVFIPVVKRGVFTPRGQLCPWGRTHVVKLAYVHLIDLLGRTAYIPTCVHGINIV